MSERSAGSTVLGLALMTAFGAAGFTVVAVNLGAGFAIPVGIVAFIAAAVVLRGPLGQALARRLESRSGSSEGGPTLQDVDEVRARLAELEERVDFAERMLAQHREPERLQSGVNRG